MHVSFHPCSTIHTALPLIRASEKEGWPKPGEAVFVTVPQRAFFYGRPVCQIGQKSTAGAYFLGLCTEDMNELEDITSVGTTIRFCSVMLRGLCYKDDKIVLSSPEMLDCKTCP